MTPSVDDWAEKVLPGPPRPAAERAIAIGDWPDGQADASAARDEHAAVAAAQLKIKPWCRCPCRSWPR